jgi:glucose-fructose oxidoreductase
MTDNSITKRAVLGSGLAMAAFGVGGRAQAQGRKLGYAIVGLGYYATRQIMPAFAHCEHARLTALVSGTPEKLERFGTEYGIPATHRYSYRDFDRIRDNPDVDIAYVVLPNSMHAEYTVRAARAGKHVMCEKPMATSVAECEQMIAACRAAKVKLMIGYRSRFEANNRRGIEIARSDRLGGTRLIESDHGFNIGDPTQWRLKKALSGGGALMDIGIYSLQAARYLSGEEPVEVSAVEHTDRKDVRFREVDDLIAFQLKFPSGKIANCVSSYSTNHNNYRVYGPQGALIAEPATAYSGHTLRLQVERQAAEVITVANGKNQFAGQLDHLAECVKSGSEPIVPGEEGLRDLRIMTAIYEAARERKVIRL